MMDNELKVIVVGIVVCGICIVTAIIVGTQYEAQKRQLEYECIKVALENKADSAACLKR